MAASHPPWLKIAHPGEEVADQVESLLVDLGLHTVCDQAQCPNRPECFSQRTATFLILGGVCTRNCSFCAVSSGRPAPPDPEEPAKVARAASQLGLRFVVVTSVTRDDLPDGGAGQFAATIGALRNLEPAPRVEVLVPDFQGEADSLQTVLDAGPDVLNHNLETVPRLYPAVRPQAGFDRSLQLIHRASRAGLLTKSGLMLGLGERRNEVEETLRRLRQAGCRLVTLGQYLCPGEGHHPVVRYLSPGEFDDLGELARRMGFSGVASAPLVRSSYRAGNLFSG